LPTTFVTVTVNGRAKKVEDYVAAPDSVAQFEREIDAAAGTKRCVFLDEETLEELARSGCSEPAQSHNAGTCWKHSRRPSSSV
jgi:hypothetical protein